MTEGTEVYKFQLVGDSRILGSLEISAESISEAYAQAKKIARATIGVTAIKHNAGLFSG